MAKKIYNKLVRDKIPEIIKNDNCQSRIKILNDEEYVEALFNKLTEETDELIAAKKNSNEAIKEIGDIHEVIDAIIIALKLDRHKIMELKENRRKQRGGFSKKVFLEYVEE